MHGTQKTVEDDGAVFHREQIELCRMIDINDSGKLRLVGFEEEIAWVRSCEATVKYLHGCEVLKTGSTYCDAGHLGSVAQRAAEAAEDSARGYEVEPSSTLEIIVEASATEYPRIEVEDPTLPKSSFGRYRSYRHIPEDAMPHGPEAERWMTATDRERFEMGGRPGIKPRVVWQSVVWSSKRTVAENAATVADFERRVRQADPTD